MKYELPEQPTALVIDVDQWRRDIRTFSDTTSQALETIVAQLSNSCSTGRSSSRLPSSDRLTSEDSNQNSSTTFSASGINSDERLAKLKSQLAQRIQNRAR